MSGELPKRPKCKRVEIKPEFSVAERLICEIVDNYESYLDKLAEELQKLLEESENESVKNSYKKVLKWLEK